MRKRNVKMAVVYGVELICVAFMLVFIFKGDNADGRVSHAQVNRISQTVPEQQVEKEQTPVSSVEQSEELAHQKEEAAPQPVVVIEKETEDILLVNKDNKLPDDYKVTLKTMPDGVNKAAEEAYNPLCNMLAAGRKEGLAFEICSSYRDVKRQQELFDEDLNALMRRGYTYEEAYAEVAKETMPPGHSEHSTGLAFDIVALGYQMLDEGQERTAENVWLQEHCAEYGFILRYPKGKEDITAISYESWHFRYVGVEVAKYIMEKGITLEEYLQGA